MKKEISIVVALALAATGILFALNLTSGKPNTVKNGFSRNMSNARLKEVARLKLSSTLFHIVGARGDSLYFTGKIPGCVYLITSDLTKIDTLDLQIPKPQLLLNHFPTFVQYPDVFVIGGNARQFIHGNLATGKFSIDTLISKGSPLNVVKISDGTYIIRRITEINRNGSFAKLNIYTNEVTSEKNISPTLGDAGFTYDGTLSYDSLTNTLIHVPYYNNNITTFDTNLNLIARHHSIDTHFVAKNQSINIGTTVTFKEPPVTINGRSWAHNGLLYILSQQQAENESSAAFNTYSPIDVYEISSGKYLNSYKLPILHGQNVADIMMVSDADMICAYSKKLVHYRIIH